MNANRPPVSVVVAAAILGTFVLELLFRYGRSLIQLLGTPTKATAIALALLLIAAVFSIAVTLLPIVFLLRGLKGGAIISTIIASWELSELVTVHDLPSWVLAPLAVVVMIAVWLPPSRRFVMARGASEISASTGVHS